MHVTTLTQHASVSCLLMFTSCFLCLVETTKAFPVPLPPFFEHRIVDHVDQLQQFDESGGRVLPPHLFRLPAPGGDVCLIVDEKGAYHAVRDVFPPLGLRVSETGVVDTQVGAIGDTLFGTRFHLSDGTVRGPWCPGGTAGPLLRLARRLPRKLWQWIYLRRTVQNYHGYTPPFTMKTRSLEVLHVAESPDGSLTLLLSSLAATKRGGAEISPIWSSTSWAKKGGLTGYDH